MPGMGGGKSDQRGGKRPGNTEQSAKDLAGLGFDCSGQTLDSVKVGMC